jgi:fructokinase
MKVSLYGGIEAGGTKFVCLVGNGPGDVRAQTRIATTEPAQTLDRAISFFRQVQTDGVDLRAIGIASFGPLELRATHPKFGHITRTPKAGWSDVDLVGPIARAFKIPIGFETDVNGAALGESRWGAARGLHSFVYLTIGTGIGGGAVVDGRVVHGLGHPEMGHVSVPRQAGDVFLGACPFHGDCLEGMASGPAIEARWGRPPEELNGSDLRRAVELETAYLAAGIRSIVFTLAPERIVVGGGVAEMAGFLPELRSALDSLARYPGLPEHGAPDFVRPAELGPMAGALGALALAENAAAKRSR